MGVYHKFFELIRVALGTQDALTAVPSADEWRGMFDLARKQTLIGVCFTGVERLPETQRPPKELILQWWAMTRKIEERNRVMDERTEEATRFFRAHGFRTAILKGQGIAALYERKEEKRKEKSEEVGDLRLRRQSGDIDIWVVPETDVQGVRVEKNEKRKEKKGNAREVIYQFARENDPEGKLHGVNYHHVHYHLFGDAEVEVHIYPGYLHNPLSNKRLHRFFETHSPTESETPSKAFNLVYILLHIYNHLLGHGVGLRQVMDYYFVLKTQDGRCRMEDGRCEAGASVEEYDDARKWIERLGMMRVAGATMWVMQEVFGLEREYMLVEPDPKEGRFLLEEICQTGNMGHYDQRHWGSLQNPTSRFFYNLRRDWHLISHYPQEVCWQPLFSIWLNIRRFFWTR